MSVVKDLAKAVPWGKIGGAVMSLTGAALTAYCQKRNQERCIEKCSAELAKKVIEETRPAYERY